MIALLGRSGPALRGVEWLAVNPRAEPIPWTDRGGSFAHGARWLRLPPSPRIDRAPAVSLRALAAERAAAQEAGR